MHAYEDLASGVNPWTKTFGKGQPGMFGPLSWLGAKAKSVAYSKSKLIPDSVQGLAHSFVTPIEEIMARTAEDVGGMANLPRAISRYADVAPGYSKNISNSVIRSLNDSLEAKWWRTPGEVIYDTVLGRKIRRPGTGGLSVYKKQAGFYHKNDAAFVTKTASWLERYLSMFAARDAAHQADPTRDALSTKLLGGPLSMGLSEMLNNRVILGATPGARSRAMHEAARDVKAESYPETLMRGLKSSPSYMGVGAAAGAGIPVLTSKLRGQPVDGTRALYGAGIGAAGGLGLALLRPLIQKAILGSVSRASLHRGIATKARNPTWTALPLGDVFGATQ